VTVDVAVFEQLLSNGTLETLERAVALYQGDLLDGFAIQDPSFEDWLVGERQRLRNSVEEALTNLMEQSTDYRCEGPRSKGRTASSVA
jgi:Bacterial transcriptional activator domain.